MGTAAVASEPHRIVVVGGGAGGLELATRLGDSLGRKGVVEVTLIDKLRTHLWKPLLHEVAAGTMDLAVHEINFLAQAHWHGFRYSIGEMIGLDRAKREVLLGAYVDDEGQQVTPERHLVYDTLVVAVGSQSNDFSTPGVRQHAIKNILLHLEDVFLGALGEVGIEPRGAIYECTEQTILPPFSLRRRPFNSHQRSPGVPPMSAAVSGSSFTCDVDCSW